MKKEKLCAISPTSRSPDIDAGWAWIIAVAALFASAISSGKLFWCYIQFVLLYSDYLLIYLQASTSLLACISQYFWTSSRPLGPLPPGSDRSITASTCWQVITIERNLIQTTFFQICSRPHVIIIITLGPIATFSIRRIGCRWTVMIGGMTSMIGLALSSVAPSLTMLFFTYGGITGM